MTVTDQDRAAELGGDEPEGGASANTLREPEVEDAFERTVLEGRRRMSVVMSALPSGRCAGRRWRRRR